MFKKRMTKFYGEEKRNKGPSNSSGLKGCPDVWELENGDYAVIGIRSTGTLAEHLPQQASCGPDEEIVVVPKAVFESR